MKQIFLYLSSCFYFFNGQSESEIVTKLRDLSFRKLLWPSILNKLHTMGYCYLLTTRGEDLPEAVRSRYTVSLYLVRRQLCEVGLSA